MLARSGVPGRGGACVPVDGELKAVSSTESDISRARTKDMGRRRASGCVGVTGPDGCVLRRT